jgi:hypothetical protein
MAEQFDDICRILATPMPRSRALKLIAGALAGAVMAPFGFAQQRAGNSQDRPCPRDRVCVGAPRGNCCPPGQKCCRTSLPGFCCPNPHECCSNTCCPPPRVCEDGVCRKRRPSPRFP